MCRNYFFYVHLIRYHIRLYLLIFSFVVIIADTNHIDREMFSFSTLNKLALLCVVLVTILEFSLARRIGHQRPFLEEQISRSKHFTMASNERERVLNLIRGRFRSRCPSFDLDPEGGCQVTVMDLTVSLPGCQATHINFTFCAGNCRSVAVNSIPEWFGDDCAILRNGFNSTSSCQSIGEEEQTITFNCEEGERTRRLRRVTDCRCTGRTITQPAMMKVTPTTESEFRPSVNLTAGENDADLAEL